MSLYARNKYKGDFITSFKFRVLVEGPNFTGMLRCNKVSGISSETNILKVKEVTSPLVKFIPTLVEYKNVTIEQGIFDRPYSITEIEEWRWAANFNLENRPYYDVSIGAWGKGPHPSSGVPYQKGIKLVGCYPVKISYGDLNAMESGIWFNSIELAVSYIRLEQDWRTKNAITPIL